MSLQSFINGTLNEQQIKHKQVLNPDDKSELREHTFNSNDENLNCRCPITMNEFKDGEKITMLPCGHLFDSESIEQWVTSNEAKCPICRNSLKNTVELRIEPMHPEPIQQSSSSTPSRVQSFSRLLESISNYMNTYEENFNWAMTPDISNNELNTYNVNENVNEEPVDISENNVDISENNIDISENNVDDLILSSINNYIRSINTIINRRIQEEDDNILQQAILDSLREQ
tara:strand:+ start:111 stop:800 length:690 start_codon:yes stop_codon:yes gene_type:complete